MIKTSYLRVYQPLSDFPLEDRRRWSGADQPAADDSAGAWRSWLIGAILPAGGAGFVSSEGASLREAEGRIYVCPWRTRLRMLAGMLAFRDSVPEEVAEAFVPQREALRAARELARIGERDPGIRSHILHANWHVPLRWFAAFQGSERVLVEDRHGLRVRYQTSLVDAKARLARALSILDEAKADGGVIEAFEELQAWLADFNGEGLLELDYGSVASMFPDDDLADDGSASEVWAWLEALSCGDDLRAGRSFGALADKWAELRAREVAN
ncbi:MAG: hypothetical protein H0V97_13010 [Actinobacteria bacterium]|nr:hypothetical protein [Actinomycetota bacterium]